MLRKALASIVLCLLPAMVASGQDGEMWVSPSHIATLPMTGDPWLRMKSQADVGDTVPKVSDQNDEADQTVLACAFLAIRYEGVNPTTAANYRNKCISIINAAIGTDDDPHDGDAARTLAAGRNVCAYVVSADLIGYISPAFDAWLAGLPNKTLDGKTMRSTLKNRPNNWGLMNAASLAAIAIRLGDTALLAEVNKVFKGYCGDRNSWKEKIGSVDGFIYGDDLSWHEVGTDGKPILRGIVRKGAVKQGMDIGGVMPDDWRRAGSFKNPPPKGQNYPAEGLQGAVTCAELLTRNGYPDAWEYEDAALIRAWDILYRTGSPAASDDTWQMFLVNAATGSSFPTTPEGSTHGKIMGWTSWTHATPSLPDPIVVDSVSLNAFVIEMLEGETFQLVATVRDTNGNILTDRPVTWSTNAADIADVDSDGTILGISVGLAEITATCEGKTAKCLVAVDELDPPDPEFAEIFRLEFTGRVIAFYTDLSGGIWYKILPDGEFVFLF